MPDPYRCFSSDETTGTKKMMIKKILITFTALLLFTGTIFPGDLYGANSRQRDLDKIERDMLSGEDPAKAVSKLNAMLDGARRPSRIYMILGFAHYGLMKYEKAYEHFKKSEEIGAKREFKKLLLYAIEKVEENKYILENIEEAKNAVEAETGSADALQGTLTKGHLTMLNTLMNEKHYYPAIIIPHLEWIKENMPDLPGLSRFSADILYAAMFYRKASEDYKKAIEEEPENVQLYSSLADCLVALGDFDNAEGYYEQAIELYEKQGTEEASGRALKLQELKQALPKKYEDISALMKKRKFRQAEEICRERLSLNSDDYVAITQLGQIYWERGKKKEAIKFFRKATRVAPDYPIAHLFLGKAYLFEKKIEKGFAEFDAYKKKMKLLPEMDKETIDYHTSNLHYIGYMHSTRGHYKEALREYKKITKLKPEDQEAYYNMAVCYYTYYHKNSKAYSNLQKVIEIDPDTRMADKAKFYIDYMRRNPDSRSAGDFTFIYEE